MTPKKHSKSCCPAWALARHVTSTLINSNQVDIELQSFGHIYRLHRVILSQVELFRNLSNDSGPGPISITFPGHIHRAAFEICLTRIYGGGPELVPPPWASVDSEPFLLGRTHALLSRAVDLDTLNSVDDQDVADEKADWESLLKTEDSQPAPPTLLISILSCANYLGLQTLADEVADLINHTITPFTVVTYLKFVHGDCLDNETLSECLQTGCRTLEGVARPAPENPDHHYEIMQESQSNEQYAEKIGQVCASWLSKWASELLALEEVLINQDENILLPALPEEIELVKRWPALRRPPMCVWRYKGGLNSTWVRVLISSDGLFLGPEICGPQDQRPGEGRGGEWERYGLARRVSKLRERERREWLDSGGFEKRVNVPSSSITFDVKPDRDALSSSYKRDPELIRMFHDGIYYSHLTFQQLAFVADDRCPIWKTEYVSPPRLQRANWLANKLLMEHDMGKSLTRRLVEVSEKDLPLYAILQTQYTELVSGTAPPRLTDPKYFGIGRDILTALPNTQLDDNRLVTSFEPYRFSAEFESDKVAALVIQSRPGSINDINPLPPPIVGCYAGLHFEFGILYDRYSHMLVIGLQWSLRDNQEAPASTPNGVTPTNKKRSYPRSLNGYFSFRVSTLEGLNMDLVEMDPNEFGHVTSAQNHEWSDAKFLGVSARKIGFAKQTGERGTQQNHDLGMAKPSGLRCTALLGLV